MSEHILIFVLAGVEELIKAYLVVLFRDTKFKIASYFVTPVGEGLLNLSEIHQHALSLGASTVVALLTTISVVVSVSSLHVFTSLAYARSRRIYVTLAAMTSIHALWNVTVNNLPTFELAGYTFVPWLLAVAAGLLIYLWCLLEDKWVEGELNPK
ncbi:hypothetical protein AB4Y96_11240 [Phyllobacterium sp. TAF24]|uniref:hypothetical protein n=1 Tax=Phyllobacterium sp. TAF24 TaxID=3233068 RepID=UPI003F977393